MHFSSRETLKVIAKVIRTRRTSIGLTIEEASDKAGLKPSIWLLIECGEQDYRLDYFLRICAALDLEPADVLRDFEE